MLMMINEVSQSNLQLSVLKFIGTDLNTALNK